MYICTIIIISAKGLYIHLFVIQLYAVVIVWPQIEQTLSVT